jgi:hypothetical protein
MSTCTVKELTPSVSPSARERRHAPFSGHAIQAAMPVPEKEEDSGADSMGEAGYVLGKK